MAFTLATFNTFWLFDNEAPFKRWGLKLPEGGLQEKIETTAKAIIDISPTGPDIIALQEVEGEVVLTPLLNKLKETDSSYQYYWCSDTLDPFTGQNVAIISKLPASIKPVTRLDQTTIDYVDHRERVRVGSLGKFLRVDIEVDDDILSVFVAHLKSRRGGTEQTRLLRDAQAKILRRLTLPRIEQGNSSSPSFVAVVGDFNDVPKSSPLEIIQGKRDPSYNLESAILNLAEDEKWTYIHNGEKEQLDHILLSKFTFDRLVDSGVARIGSNVSDHDAIWATIDLTQ
jgi:endonuclease/exonuclease/phosphatase family metal-dependent hydrolase